MREYKLLSYIPEGRPPRVIALISANSAEEAFKRLERPGFRLIPGHYAVVSQDRTDRFMFEVKEDK